MSGRFLPGADNVVARSLRITRGTQMLVASLTGAVAANVMVAIQLLGLLGQAVLLVLVFASLGVAVSAACSDMLARSGQAVANLQSIGASRGGLSGAVLGAVLAWGLAGALLGVGLGTLLGLGVSGSAGAGVSLALEAGSVVAASAGAIIVGVFAGVKVAWPS